MTPFGLLLKLSGMTQAEAAAYLNVSKVSVDKMARGQRGTSAGVLAQMRELIRQQQAAADEFMEMVDEMSPPEIELGYPADDYEAQQLGMPTISAWMAIAARVIAEADVPVILVPRGSDLVTAAAIDAHEADS